MPLRLPLTKQCSYCSNQGRSSIFVGDKICAKLGKCLQVIRITHSYANDVPLKRYEASHKFRLLLIQMCIHRSDNENISFASCLQKHLASVFNPAWSNSH